MLSILVQFLLDKKILLNAKKIAVLRQKSEADLSFFFESIKDKESEEIRQRLEDLFEEKKDISLSSSERAAEKSKEGSVSVLTSFESKEVSKKVGDFVSYFNARYKAIEKMLRNRQELQSMTAMRRLAQKEEREPVSVIGIVKEIELTKNENIIMILEDQTGETKVLVSKSKKELYMEGKSIVRDEIIGVIGVSGKGIIFAEKIIWPDVPVYNELKKAPEEEYALFLSDIHVGSKQFLAKSFEKFIKWINGGLGDEKQRELVKKVKYIFIVGDIVDGVGVYPSQENDLEILNIFDQYKECAKLIAQIPVHIKIIITPGNHDAMRLAEPQLPLYEDIAKPLYDLSNVMMLSNPAMVTLAKSETFPGINVLLYHGYSFDHYIANVDEIRNNGGYDRADLVMKFLLKRRHLAPTHASCVYIPFAENDPMVISKIPDIFATGHLHKTSVSTYRNITLLCGSCWQGKTAFQEKMGHNPEPGRVPAVNLQTREVRILRFGEE